MSILIKDMGMPKTGEYRCVIRKWQQGGPITIDLYGEEELCGTIVPVPPHGRLIDADALYSHIKDEQRKCNDPYDGWSECQVALGFVNTAPTIIKADRGDAQ